MPLQIIITQSKQQSDNFRMLLESAGTTLAVSVSEPSEPASEPVPEHAPEKAIIEQAVCACGFVAKSQHGLKIHSFKHKKASKPLT
jgi:hypothetical protein